MTYVIRFDIVNERKAVIMSNACGILDKGTPVTYLRAR